MAAGGVEAAGGVAADGGLVGGVITFNVLAIHEPSSCFLPEPLARKPSLISAKTAGSRSFLILVLEVTLTVVSPVLFLRVSVIAVASTAVMVPPNRAARGLGAAGVLVEVESCAFTGSAAHAMAVSRTNESFVIDFIFFVNSMLLNFTGPRW